MEWVISYFVVGWVLLTALENISRDFMYDWFYLKEETGNGDFFVDMFSLMFWPLVLFMLVFLFRWERIGVSQFFGKMKGLTLFPKFRK